MARESRVGDQALLVYPSEDDVAAGLAGYTAKLSEEFAKGRGAFTVVLSGGYLINCLRKLLEPPYVDGVDWGKWHVFWVDERVVLKTDKDSNYKLAYDGFLSKVPIPENQVYAINDTLSAEGAADDYEECLKKLVKAGVIEVSPTSGFPRFDLMLLGMGPDGHLASLFPHHPLLKEKKRWVTFIKDSPKPPPVRITFTFPVIDASAYIAMVVVGNGEVEAVRKALGPHNDQSDLLPVQMVSLENGEFTWFTDKEATSELPDLPNP
ncbi:probable 6-phosphogluconolactonase 4, chloroplastic [Asparagus officinalis]|uniref:probable 6-phosphogluconolactonase 4, chloroplastic n=1 Tax=Asparagus officinalis TaxID=4686 RepID=UPI00098E109D|nr:probable 6-phosphogluconolactonase 4, chloroplastic [Asparagus officinalis]